MTEEERVKNINIISAKKMEEFLLKIENDEITMDEMIATAYSAMVVVSTMGFSVKSMAEDASKAADQLLGLLEDDSE